MYVYAMATLTLTVSDVMISENIVPCRGSQKPFAGLLPHIFGTQMPFSRTPRESQFLLGTLQILARIFAKVRLASYLKRFIQQHDMYRGCGRQNQELAWVLSTMSCRRSVSRLCRRSNKPRNYFTLARTALSNNPSEFRPYASSLSCPLY